MRQDQKAPTFASKTLERIQQEYVELLGRPPYSLEKLFSPQDFHFDAFCKGFYPHPQSEELKNKAQAYGEMHGFWLPNAKHHITCALFLYPNAEAPRMLSMMNNLTLGFYLNDVMGRDTFRFQSVEKQIASRKMIRQMAALDETLVTPPDADLLEVVNADILREFKERSPKWWFDRFLQIYCYHIGITHMDGNVDAQGRIPEVIEYMDYRCHLGGVHHILHWIEFSDGQFLDWDLLNRQGLSQKLRRLHWVTAAFAGLSNDLFSFEKEVIDNGSDSNLVMMMALNNPEMPLREAVIRSAEIVRNLLLELLSLLDFFRKGVELMKDADPSLSSKMSNHLDGIVRCVQAVWMWHCHSKRYKRPVSLWEETRLVGEAVGTGL